MTDKKADSSKTCGGGSGAIPTIDGDGYVTAPIQAKLKRETVDIEGCGKFLLQQLNAKDFADYQASTVKINGADAQPDLRAAKFMLVAMMWIRPDGRRVIAGPEKVPQLYGMDAAIIDQLYEAGDRLMSDGRPPIKELVGN